MPDMDGLDATQIIKASWPETRVIVMTIDASYQIEAFAAGADAFFVKGPSTQDLLEAIVGKRKEAGSTVFSQAPSL